MWLYGRYIELTPKQESEFRKALDTINILEIEHNELCEKLRVNRNTVRKLNELTFMKAQEIFYLNHQKKSNNQKEVNNGTS